MTHYPRNGSWYFSPPTSKDSTRDCLDPWFFAMLNAKRELQPCCAHPGSRLGFAGNSGLG